MRTMKTTDSKYSAFMSGGTGTGAYSPSAGNIRGGRNGRSKPAMSADVFGRFHSSRMRPGDVIYNVKFQHVNGPYGKYPCPACGSSLLSDSTLYESHIIRCMACNRIFTFVGSSKPDKDGVLLLYGRPKRKPGESGF